ncbi:hypothetical protein RSAG8_10677, partial [Rhizoctonia solani AG-8 WAC10335]
MCDDEAGESDAGSINDDVERGLPTSSHWDPGTKKSTTPRGSEPHPHMDVVEAELKRNQEYDARLSQEHLVPGMSTAPTCNGQSSAHDTSPVRPVSDIEMAPANAVTPSTNTGVSERPGHGTGAEDVEMADGMDNLGPSVAGPSTNSITSSRAITGTGPPRTFAPPPPNAPTIRSGYRSGPQSGTRTLAQARIRDQARGYTVEPQ